MHKVTDFQLQGFQRGNVVESLICWDAHLSPEANLILIDSTISHVFNKYQWSLLLSTSSHHFNFIPHQASSVLLMLMDSFGLPQATAVDLG